MERGSLNRERMLVVMQLLVEHCHSVAQSLRKALGKELFLALLSQVEWTVATTE